MNYMPIYIGLATAVGVLLGMFLLWLFNRQWAKGYQQRMEDEGNDRESANPLLGTINAGKTVFEKFDIVFDSDLTTAIARGELFPRWRDILKDIEMIVEQSSDTFPENANTVVIRAFRWDESVGRMIYSFDVIHNPSVKSIKESGEDK